MATKYRLSKLQEILNLFKELGVDITSEIEDTAARNGDRYVIKFEGLSKEDKVQKLIEVLNHELHTIGTTVDTAKLEKLKTKLEATSVRNLKVVRSRLIHIRKQSWADQVETDSD
jgi:hypothetical protein